MTTFVNPNHSHHPSTLPATKTGEVGSAKRNIIRKGGGSKVGKGHNSGKSHLLDDGSTYNDPCALDEHDPNYDSEEENGKEFIPKNPYRSNYNPQFRVHLREPSMTLAEYKTKITPLLEELFISSDYDEFKRRVFELDVPDYSYELVKRAMNMSFDRSDREREIISQMLSISYPDLLSSNMIGKGFERIFEVIDDIEKDAPTARDMTAMFLARCVVDEVLPPSFLSDVIIMKLGGDVVDHARRMLSREHGACKLMRVWGPGDGRPVYEMKEAVDQLLMEYLLSGDMSEAVRCIRELHSPHFHHEIVKRGIVLAIDKPESQRVSLSALLKHLVDSAVVSQTQCVLGFNRLHAIVQEDLILDVPAAPQILEEFKVRAVYDGILPADYAPQLQA